MLVSVSLISIYGYLNGKQRGMLNSKLICSIGMRLLKGVALTKIVGFRRNVELFFMATEDLEERYILSLQGSVLVVPHQ